MNEFINPARSLQYHLPHSLPIIKLLAMKNKSNLESFSNIDSSVTISTNYSISVKLHKIKTWLLFLDPNIDESPDLENIFNIFAQTLIEGTASSSSVCYCTGVKLSAEK